MAIRACPFLQMAATYWGFTFVGDYSQWVGVLIYRTASHKPILK
jgi:hypothetical protein